ncbi:MAG: VCBS repeat-containing protein [Bacteroidia bacterium]
MRLLASFFLISLAFGCSSPIEEDFETTPPAQPVTEYTLTVSTEDGGTVDSSGGTYESGSDVTITAIPNDEYVFSGWSNGSTENPLTLTINSNLSISANFTAIIDCSDYESNDLNLNDISYNLFRIDFPVEPTSDNGINGEMRYWLGYEGEYGFGSSYVDYNNDGIKDVVGYKNNYLNFIDREEGYTGYERKLPIRFFLGDCQGGFTADPQNDQNYLGLVHGRKLLIGDFNSDEFVDFFLIGHGYDKEPFPGEFQKSLISDGNGGFIETNYVDNVSFYHGGASGDFDNDGDLDVLVVDAGDGNSGIFINNNGTFTFDNSLINQSLMNGMYNAEFYDVDEDGYLDIVSGGHDWAYQYNAVTNTNNIVYTNTPLIIYGNGVTYNHENFTRLPAHTISNQGIVTEFKFLDIDNDQSIEVLLVRTGDNTVSQSNFYQGWSIQILKRINQSYVDYTSQLMDVNNNLNGNWIERLDARDKDNDGVIELFNSSIPNSNEQYLEWELVNGRFIKVN